jgi:hypothetical protein
VHNDVTLPEYTVLNMVLPIFHSFAHSHMCQVSYSPRYCEGYGLTDGEAMERLWSRIGRLATATRHMSAGAREITLEYAIRRQKSKKLGQLGEFLLARYNSATSIVQVALIGLGVTSSLVLPKVARTRLAAQLQEFRDLATKPLRYQTWIESDLERYYLTILDLEDCQDRALRSHLVEECCDWEDQLQIQQRVSAQHPDVQDAKRYQVWLYKLHQLRYHAGIYLAKKKELKSPISGGNHGAKKAGRLIVSIAKQRRKLNDLRKEYNKLAGKH